jgi:hypothetical protein
MTNNDAQSIRSSQIILTYGPGAIIESKEGPVAILSLDQGLRKFDLEQYKRNEISNDRICAILKEMTGKDARVFTIPTNESRGLPPSSILYYTIPFPKWHICYEKGRHPPRNQPVLFEGRECPVCGKKGTTSAVRFVAACPKGHMSDAPWHLIVHRYGRCDTKYYWWDARGSSLQDVKITCPTCSSSTDMGKAYSRKDYPCTGWFIENRSEDLNNCSENMFIMQRQSTSLRQPEIFTLLKIPDDDPLPILHQEKIRSICNTVATVMKRAEPNLTIETLSSTIEEALLAEKVDESRIAQLMHEISTLSVDEFMMELDVKSSTDRKGLDFIYEEFRYLTNGPRKDDGFSMGAPVLTGALESLPPLATYPISEIRTATVQMGYRRMVPVDDPNKRKRVDVCVEKGGYHWFPGYEGIGEGLFITVQGSNTFLDGGRAYAEWKKNITHPDVIGPIGTDSIWADLHQEPLWVWYHTLSHAFIKAISMTSGYSAASIRERIYLGRDGRRGGILLYTTASGEDSSMGGLMESCNMLDEILPRAIESLEFCSNDPLCHDERKTEQRVHGAACFGCLMISETSCEHGNYWLDRHLVLND